MFYRLLEGTLSSILVARGARRKSIRLPSGVNLSYWDAGHHESTIVLVHGLGSSSLSYARVVFPLTRTHRVLVPDMPGFGRSKLPKGEGHYDVDRHVAALIAFLETLPQPPILVGQSLGAWIVGKAAHRRPDLIEQLILVNPAGVHYPEILTLRDRLKPKTRDEVFAFWDLIYHRRPKLARFLWKDAAARMHTSSVTKFLETVEARDFLNEDLPNLEIPTTLIVGRHDRLIPAHTIDIFLQRLGSTRLHWIPDCAHVPQVETPKEFVRILVATAHQRPEQRPRPPAEWAKMKATATTPDVGL